VRSHAVPVGVLQALDASPPLDTERIAAPLHACLVRSSVEMDEIAYRALKGLCRINRFGEAFTLIPLAFGVRHARLLEHPDFRRAGSASTHEHQHQRKSHDTGHVNSPF
jgi:hypothetical protein